MWTTQDDFPGETLTQLPVIDSRRVPVIPFQACSHYTNEWVRSRQWSGRVLSIIGWHPSVYKSPTGYMLTSFGFFSLYWFETLTQLPVIDSRRVPVNPFQACSHYTNEWVRSQQWSGRLLSIIGWDPSAYKSQPVTCWHRSFGFFFFLHWFEVDSILYIP